MKLILERQRDCWPCAEMKRVSSKSPQKLLWNCLSALFSDCARCCKLHRVEIPLWHRALFVFLAQAAFHNLSVKRNFAKQISSALIRVLLSKSFSSTYLVSFGRNWCVFLRDFHVGTYFKVRRLFHLIKLQTLSLNTLKLKTTRLSSNCFWHWIFFWLLNDSILVRLLKFAHWNIFLAWILFTAIASQFHNNIWHLFAKTLNGSQPGAC